jgi:hypothetical protein
MANSGICPHCPVTDAEAKTAFLSQGGRTCLQ